MEVLSFIKFIITFYIFILGIRLGEMERDGLLAHGISYTLHDRLMNCSDYSEVNIAIYNYISHKKLINIIRV